MHFDTPSFKQIKQNFPLKYFYGESANAIKIQIWVTLIANLLLKPFQPSGKGLGNAFGRESERRLSTVYFLMGLGITK